MVNARLRDSSRYIFFIQLTDELPRAYFYLSAHLNAFNISLVPISSSDFAEISQRRRVTAVSFVYDLRSLGAFKKLRNRFLNLALTSKKINLIHVSSFQPLENSYRLERLGVYQFIELPIYTKELAKKVATYAYQEKVEEKRWPGGRRSAVLVK